MMSNKYIDWIHIFLTKNKIIVIIIIILGILGTLYSFLPQENTISINQTKIENVNSPNSINIIGDNNNVENLEIPPPNFIWDYKSKNEYVKEYISIELGSLKNIFRTEANLVIDSKIPVKQITLFSPDANVIDLTAAMVGITNTNRGYGEYNGTTVKRITIQNPIGPYEVIIYSKAPLIEDFKLLIQYN